MSVGTKRLLVDFAGGLVCALAAARLRGLFRAETAAAVFAALCDGFFVAAVLLLGLGALAFVRNDGAFDAAFFSLRKVFQLKWPGLGDWREEYIDYKTQKRTRRASPRPQLLAGGAYLLLAVGCLGVYLLLEG